MYRNNFRSRLSKAIWIGLLVSMVMFQVACGAVAARVIASSTATAEDLALPEEAVIPANNSAATNGLIPIEVLDVQVEVGIGSPIPVHVQAAGTWPGLCAQLAAVEQQVSDFQFDITLLAHPGDPDCPPDHMGLPFGLAIPINVVELPQGSYTVTVNGRSASFDVPVTPTMP
jgi:hypothetical protein